MSKPVLIGELNPYGGDPYYALYPAPDGCSGHRLCCQILGMQRAHYLDAFERVNLCAGKWSLPLAREAARTLWLKSDRLILCGAKVSAAFNLPFRPFDVATFASGSTLTLPHPSGLNRMWGEPGMIERAREAVRAFVPGVLKEVVDELGASRCGSDQA